MSDLVFNLNSIWSFDIDGTLTNYPKEWLQFVAENTGEHFSTTEEARRSMGSRYDELKHSYRLSEDKFQIKIRKDARSLIHQINQSGGTVIISTSRPFYRYVEMQNRTEKWLKENSLTFKKLISKPSLVEHDFDIHVDDELDEILSLPSNAPKKFIHINSSNNSATILNTSHQIHSVRSINDINAKQQSL